MPNAIRLTATIAPPGTACEGSHDDGATFRAVAVTTTAGGQEALLTAVPAGPYGVGVVRFRAVGFPASVVSNPEPLTVNPAAATANNELGSSPLPLTLT